MDYQTRQLVQESWTLLFADSKTSADVFYSKLFALDPSIQFLFKGDLDQQKQRLMGMFNVAVRGLDKLDEMLPTIVELGRRHAQYAVLDEHYETMGEALLFTLRKMLGEKWTPEIEAAWSEAYGRWAGAMRMGAALARQK